MLHIKKVLDAKPKEHKESELAVMYTPWGGRIDADHVLEEHPTPQFCRANYQVLNGKWLCAFAKGGHDPKADLVRVTADAPEPSPEAFAGEILVPFSPEAPLSGVNRRLEPDELLWYRRMFETPAHEHGERVILHFQAVDCGCTVRVNGEIVGSHVGGYTPFAFDVTDVLCDGGNVLSVCVADPSEFGGHLRGKQRFDRGDIWYSAQSGIWQTVWMEVVPADSIASIVVNTYCDSGAIVVEAKVAHAGDSSASMWEKAPQTLRVEAFEGLDADPGAEPCAVAEQEVAAPAAAPAPPVAPAAHAPSAPATAAPGNASALTAPAPGNAPALATCTVTLRVPNPKRWSPAAPNLYRLRLTYGDDVVESYCAFRTVAIHSDRRGRRRIFLNDEPLFVKGVLDQAYWPDGLMTAPADDALVFDIEAMRAAGFNLMRKHIKIETDRWYYHCDRLGMLVIQDMVSGGAREINLWEWSYKPTLFRPSWYSLRDDKPSSWEKLGADDEAYRDEWTRTARETIELLHDHPCIIGWSLFNEGWGQFNACEAAEMARSLDATRVIDATSGWYDQRCGDFHSVHNYFRDMRVWRDRGGADRAFFISEFGGLTHRIEGHSSLDEAYGYELYDDVDEWRAAVRKQLAVVDAMEKKGLAGYVYTQVSDIEEETNGILTYDRKVNKLV